jgi:diaminopimelate decarboxylase
MAREMYNTASRSPYLRPTILATHIGSQITDLDPYTKAVAVLLEMAGELLGDGIPITHLDLGGGLGIDYANNGAPSITQWLQAVALPVYQAGFSLVVEPGRSIVGPAGILLTQVIYTKEQGGKRFLITDAGMSDLIRPALYQAYHTILPVGAPADGAPEEACDIVGPVCETGDWLARDRPMVRSRPGDLLAVMQAGAYGFAMSSNYNGRLRPAEVLVSGHEFRIVRRRQGYQHLIDGCLDQD